MDNKIRLDKVRNLFDRITENESYRDIIYNGADLQLVGMNLEEGEDIEKEIHDADQFFYLIQGSLTIKIEYGVQVKTIKMKEGDFYTIPKGAYHYVKNTFDGPSKLFTIYSHKEH